MSVAILNLVQSVQELGLVSLGLHVVLSRTNCFLLLESDIFFTHWIFMVPREASASCCVETN